jgi:dihydrodipicolinate synthase/N-acetylneuraminate lyase
MAQPDFYTMCATVFARDGRFDESTMRRYLQRQIEARLGVYLGSGGNGETHAMSVEELSRLYGVGVEECKGKVPVHANLPEEHTAEQTIAQARIAVAAGVEALHLYTVEGRHGYVPTEAELIGYFDDVLAAIQHPVVIAVNPTMGYIPRPQVIAEICRRHEQVIAVRLSAQRDIYLLNVQDALGRAIHCHWQLGSGALDPLALGTSLFAAEANVIPQTFRRFVDLAQAGQLAAAGEVLGQIRRFNQLVMEWGPCARWIKMAMKFLKLPGWEGGLRRPYLMPTDDVVIDFGERLLQLRIPEIDAMARAAGVTRH